MTGGILREGGTADLPAVMAVMTRAFDPAFGEAWNHAQCQGILSLPNVWLSVAEGNEHAGGRGAMCLSGFALSRLVLDEVELLLLAVDPGARRRGVGAALIARTTALALQRAARHLFLEVRADNPALLFYQQAGFAQVGRRASYYRGADGCARDAITLSRTLSSHA